MLPIKPLSPNTNIPSEEEEALQQAIEAVTTPLSETITNIIVHGQPLVISVTQAATCIGLVYIFYRLIGRI
jgi:hypothetical protein